MEDCDFKQSAFQSGSAAVECARRSHERPRWRPLPQSRHCPARPIPSHPPFVDASDRRHDLPGRAIAALKGVVVDEIATDKRGSSPVCACTASPLALFNPIVETAVPVRKMRRLNAPPGCDAELVMPPSTRELASRLCVLNDKSGSLTPVPGAPIAMQAEVPPIATQEIKCAARQSLCRSASNHASGRMRASLVSGLAAAQVRPRAVIATFGSADAALAVKSVTLAIPVVLSVGVTPVLD